MMQIWKEIPKAFRVSLIVSAILVAVISVVAGFIKDPGFGTETAITGGFSVALLCVYVVCVGRIMARVKNAMADGPDESAASSAVSRILVLSFVKLILLAVGLIVFVAVFNFDVIAAILGVSGVYPPLILVSLILHTLSPEPDETGKSA